MKRYSVIEEELLIHAKTWMDLKNHIAKKKKSDPKGYTASGCIYVALWKRQNEEIENWSVLPSAEGRARSWV